jgi:nucleotide-binding universal stress UspA family protein
MYSSILIAYDGTNHGKAALDQATALARLCGSEIHLLGIVRTSGFSALAEGAGPTDVWGEERKQIEAAMASAVQQLQEAGLKVSSEIREGDPGNEIIDAAFTLWPDLVIVGHSDRGVFARWFEGSVGAKILQDLPCDLLVAHRR